MKGPCSFLLRARQASPRAFPRLSACSSDDAAFPLFNLPAEAVELVLGCVDGLEDKRALRLVCKRTRASVDSRVVAVEGGRWFQDEEPMGELQLSALVRAPWKLQRLDLSGRELGDAGAASLAAAAWPSLQRLCLGGNRLGPAGAESLAAAAWPSLQMLWLGKNNLYPAGAAALAAAHFPALRVLGLFWNSLGDAGAAALAAAHFPALQSLTLARPMGGNDISSEGEALLQARWPTAQVHF